MSSPEKLPIFRREIPPPKRVTTAFIKEARKNAEFLGVSDHDFLKVAAALEAAAETYLHSTKWYAAWTAGTKAVRFLLGIVRQWRED